MVSATDGGKQAEGEHHAADDVEAVRQRRQPRTRLGWREATELSVRHTELIAGQENDDAGESARGGKCSIVHAEREAQD